jgi:hypothetical protein
MNPETAIIPPAPGPSKRVRELVMEKLGSLRCRHAYTLVTFRGVLFLRCTVCGAESEGLRVYTPLRGGR